MTTLTDTDATLLGLLSEDGGLTTGRVASGIKRSVFPRRKLSAVVRVALMKLRDRGLVAFRDDQKPVLWVRTRAGTLALARFNA